MFSSVKTFLEQLQVLRDAFVETEALHKIEHDYKFEVLLRLRGQVEICFL